MPIEIVVPAPPIRQGIQVSWPAPTVNIVVNGGITSGGFNQGIAFGGGAYSGFAGIPNLITTLLTGTGTASIQKYLELTSAIMVPGTGSVAIEFVATGWGGIPLSANLNAGLVMPEFFRVWRVVCLFAGHSAAPLLNWDDDTGIMLLSNEGGDNWPSNARPGFGIVGDGAGGWRWRSYSRAAFPGNVIETVAVPAGVIADVNTWSVFDLEIVNSAPGRDASISLQINGTDIVTRNWSAAPALPLLTLATVANWKLAIRAGNVGENLFLGPTTFYFGEYTRSGVRIAA